jgi:TM2 domain-containing membrane protein YozV
MKSKNVAAVLSALVFPGVGQYYLGRRMRALVFFVLAAIAGAVYFNFAIDTANAVVDQVLGGSGALDPAAITARIEAQPTPLSVTLAEIVFGVCWVGSILEALLVRRT